MPSKTLMAAAVAASLAFAQQAAADSTGNYQIDSAHDGRISFKNAFKPPLKMKWSVDLGGEMSYPVAGNGMVFVTVNLNSASQLYALDERSGATVWHKTVADTAFGANPVYDSGMVFVVNFDGLLQAFKADGVGTPVWTVQLGSNGDYSTPPTAYEGRIYLGSYDGIYSVSETDGTYAINGNGFGGASPALGNGRLFVSLPCDEMAFSAKNTRLLWDYSFGCSGGGGGNAAYFGGRMYGIDVVHGNLIFDAKTGSPTGSFAATYTPAFWKPASGNAMAFAATSNTVNAFDTVTGNNGWSFADDTGISAPPLVLDDAVAVGSFDGTLYILDAATGAQLWSAKLGGVIGNGNNLQTTGMGAGDGDLLVPSGTTLSSWIPKRKKR